MRDLLKQIGWSQAEFARQIGASQNTVSAWCRGPVDTLAYRLAIKYLEMVLRAIK